MPPHSEDKPLEQAVQCLKAGGLIAYPTEAVWGLGCDPDNEQAVNRLLALKERDVSRGLILVAANIEQLAPYLEGLAPSLKHKLAASWPGPITWLVPDNGTAPPWIKGKHSNVALRVSSHRVVAGLSQALGGPLVSTSANRHGQAPIKQLSQLRREFGAALDAVVEGALGGASRPTPLRDLITEKVWRS